MILPKNADAVETHNGGYLKDSLFGNLFLPRWTGCKLFLGKGLRRFFKSAV